MTAQFCASACPCDHPSCKDHHIIHALACNTDSCISTYVSQQACYAEEERQKGYKKKDFKQAKLDFVDQMLKWSGAKSPSRVLDVGCGIGGTTRILAKNFPDAKTQGISASLGIAPLPAENVWLQTIMVRHGHRSAPAVMPVCIMCVTVASHQADPCSRTRVRMIHLCQVLP